MALTYEFAAKDMVDAGRTTWEKISEIKEWMCGERIYPDVPDEMIILFLLSCTNDLTATQNTIQSYFKIKNRAPEIFDDRYVFRDELIKATTTVQSAFIPLRTPDNYCINFFKLADPYYGNFDLVPIMKLAYMVLETNLIKNPPDGLVVLIDVEQIGLMHLTRIHLGAFKIFFKFLQEGLQVKLKAIHILNANYVFHKFFSVIKIFMNPELVEMIQMHSPGMAMEEFHEKHLAAKYLPNEYGGGLPSLVDLNENVIEKFRDLEPFFKAEQELRRNIC